MKVELISKTEYCGSLFGDNTMVPQDLIIAIARVSSEKTYEERGNDVDKLLKYCMKNAHWSIFEMFNVCFYVETSLMVATQMLRHKSLSFQMLSQRYKTCSSLQPIELRLSSINGSRQSSEVVVGIGYNTLSEKISRVNETVMDLYTELIDSGISRETARQILPQNTTTELFVNGNIRSWIHYMEQRLSPHTQREHRKVALLIQEKLIELMPLIFNTNGTENKEIV